MAQPLTAEKIKLIRRLYAQCGVYAVVARLTGCSPVTVAKVIRQTSAESAARREQPS